MRMKNIMFVAGVPLVILLLIFIITQIVIPGITQAPLIETGTPRNITIMQMVDQSVNVARGVKIQMEINSGDKVRAGGRVSSGPYNK